MERVRIHSLWVVEERNYYQGNVLLYYGGALLCRLKNLALNLQWHQALCVCLRPIIQPITTLKLFLYECVCVHLCVTLHLTIDYHDFYGESFNAELHLQHEEETMQRSASISSKDVSCSV